MKTLFISDCHLSEATPHLTRLFSTFIEEHCGDIDALYILGDLFELCIGDDPSDSIQQFVIAQLQQLHARDIPVYIMPGNRDFLIGKQFIAKSYSVLLEDPTVIKLYQNSILLTHGDTLNKEDKAYLRFRRIVRNPIVQWLYQCLPLSWQQRIAQRIRQTTKATNQQIRDVSPEAIPALFDDYQVDHIIHGHTHIPTIHLYRHHDIFRRRIALSDWGNYGHFLEIMKDGSFTTRQVS